MEEAIFLFIFFSFSIGLLFGYYTRVVIAKRKLKTAEGKLQKRLEKVKEEAERILNEAKEQRKKILEDLEKEEEKRKKILQEKEEILLKRESLLEKKLVEFENQKEIFEKKAKEIEELEKEIKEKQENLQKEIEKIANLDKESAKRLLFEQIEKEYQKDILERIRKLEIEGEERFQEKAKKILATVIQKLALPQVQELTTSVVLLPSEEMKSRIIGKEGRNIKTFEKLTGVEVIIDETPETVILSCFDPIRREIAKLALEKLIQDGRIQPAKIEEKVEEAKKEINLKIKEAGQRAAEELGLINLDEKLLHLLGRLNFRTSYGQNVLLHSMEVAFLAEVLAEELGANAQVCKKAGLFHDIGKALDQEVEGSHVQIGIKILEKFGIEKEVISAMKSHHGDYPPESLEAIIVQVADQISGARPGARKDTVENYLRRLSELEAIANSFEAVEKSYAIQAGREIRVFVKPEKIDDLGAQKLAKEIANRIQEELKYPGEIKVTVIRETRFVEYAR